MDREEKIREASWKLTGEFSNEEFLEGIKWADEHPKEGLWDKEKVCEWLKSECFGWIFTESELDALCKAMENE